LAAAVADIALSGMTRAPTLPVQRNRASYALLAVLIIATGMLCRSEWFPLSSFLAKYAGDSLWALVVFLGFGFAFPRSSTTRIGLAAVCFAWSIEFSQLYHAPWIDEIRSTRPGQLILGNSFNSPDLIAYLIGITLGASAEYIYFHKNPKANQKA
jgi:Protein of unknown function (DUF2809)